jgi:hypothetical protein
MLRNKLFVGILLLLYISLRKSQHYQLLSSSSITRRLEDTIDFAKQCDICSYRNTNNSIHSNNEYKEEELVTVDAFYYVAWPEENWYIATGDWWLGPSLIDFFTNFMNGRGKNEKKVLARIHVLTYDDNTLIRGRAAGLPFYLYNLSDFQAV